MLTNRQIRHIVSILRDKPLERLWEPVFVGLAAVQRVPASSVTGITRWKLLRPVNPDGTQNLFSEDSIHRFTYIHLNRKPDTHILKDSGQVYMIWRVSN